MKERLGLHDGMLARRNWKRETAEEYWQIIVPYGLKDRIFDAAHGDPAAHHFGRNRVVEAIKQHYYWVGLKADVTRRLRSWTKCQSARKKPNVPHALMTIDLVGEPMQRIGVDIVAGFPRTPRGNVAVLTAIDYFTKSAYAWAIPNQEAATVAEVLVTQLFAIFGMCRELLTDQGPNFESGLFRDVCERLGIKKLHTTPYHPQGDGLVERLNRTIVDGLRKIQSTTKTDWDLDLPLLLMAYRATVQESTGETPNAMMLGRETITPLTLIVPVPRTEEN